MRWRLSHRQDPAALPLADRHYSRQKPGSDRFGQPCRSFALLTTCDRALWLTSWPFAEYVNHAWGGAWINSLFRNEGAGLSSELILEAVAATRWHFGEPPALGLITFVEPDKVRRKRDPGRCYLRAGFVQPPCPYCGGERPRCKLCISDGKARTKKKRQLVFQLLPEAMPPACAPIGAQLGGLLGGHGVGSSPPSSEPVG